MLSKDGRNTPRRKIKRMRVEKGEKKESREIFFRGLRRLQYNEQKGQGDRQKR